MSSSEGYPRRLLQSIKYMSTYVWIQSAYWWEEKVKHYTIGGKEQNEIREDRRNIN